MQPTNGETKQTMHFCLFDIDGTLLSSGGAGQAAMEAAFLAEFGLENPVEGLTTAGRTDRAIAADLFAYFNLEHHEENHQRFVRAYLERLPAELARRRGLVLPGIRELLESLSHRDDVSLGLLTGNFCEGARIKLSHHALDHHFSYGGYGDHHLDRDDVAREALAEIRRLHANCVELDRVWIIGDTPADVRCGRAIGANVVAVSTGIYSRDVLRSVGPDYLVDDFSDPGRLLQLLR
jgi:phosphoglycolate phosphatase